MWKSIMHSTAQCLLRAALLYPNTAEGITDNQSSTLDLIGRLLVPQLYPSWNLPNTNNMYAPGLHFQHRNFGEHTQAIAFTNTKLLGVF